jgi:hypothetical protein
MILDTIELAKGQAKNCVISSRKMPMIRDSKDYTKLSSRSFSIMMDNLLQNWKILNDVASSAGSD